MRHSLHHGKTPVALCVGTLLLATLAGAQVWTNPYSSMSAVGNCAGLPASLNSGFTVAPLISQAKFPSVAPYRINKMAFFRQSNAQWTDIYAVEKGNGTTKARILYYNGVDSTLKVIGTLGDANYGGGGVEEQGLTGIALNPKTFAQDNFLYLYYATGAVQAQGSSTVGFRVARFKVDPVTKMLDTASRKVLLHIPAGTSARWHTGGAMQFDNYGNLYISVGDNEALATGAGNTADLRGSILRIKPDTTVPRGYTIPARNFGSYWAQQWQDSGMTARTAKYGDTSKVKPEIYVKGTRNAYSMSLDPYILGLLSYGQCGPDAQRGEVQNVVRKPAFGGWPFWVWVGNAAVRQTAKASSYDEANEPAAGTAWTDFNPATMTTAIPVNNWSGNTGVDTLPPFNKPTYGTASPTCAQGGPIIRYNGKIPNPRKMPPHLDNVYMFTDFTQTGTSSVWAVQIDSVTSQAVGTPITVFSMTRSSRPYLSNGIDFQQGPDGALYFIDWGGGCCSVSPSVANGGIVRVTYDGDCQDSLKFFGGHGDEFSSIQNSSGPVDWLRVSPSRVSLRDDGSGRIESGAHRIRILDVNGRTVREIRGTGAREYAMPALKHGQVFVLHVESPLGAAVRTFTSL